MVRHCKFIQLVQEFSITIRQIDDSHHQVIWGCAQGHHIQILREEESSCQTRFGELCDLIKALAEQFNWTRWKHGRCGSSWTPWWVTVMPPSFFPRCFKVKCHGLYQCTDTNQATEVPQEWLAKHFYNPVSHLLALLIWNSWTTTSGEHHRQEDQPTASQSQKNL